MTVSITEIPKRCTAGLAPRSQQTLQGLFQNHIKVDMRVTVDPYRLVDMWLERGLSAATARKMLGIYRVCMEEAGRPVGDLRPLGRRLARLEGAKVAKTWTRDDCMRALNAAWHLDRELYDAIVLTLHTGLRRSELTRLCWEGVDLSSGTIRITKTKSGRPRVVQITKAMEEVLMRRYVIGVDADSRVLRRFDLLRPLRRLCKAAQVPSIRWHDLRHTFSTLLLSGGTPIPEVSAMLGHAKVSTTANIYWHLTGPSKLDESLLPSR